MLNFAVIMAILTLSCIVLVMGLTWAERRTLPRQDPEKVLADRFAKGEIDEGEYARRLGILRYGPPIELPD